MAAAEKAKSVSADHALELLDKLRAPVVPRVDTGLLEQYLGRRATMTDIEARTDIHSITGENPDGILEALRATVCHYLDDRADEISDEQVQQLEELQMQVLFVIGTIAERATPPAFFR